MRWKGVRGGGGVGGGGGGCGGGVGGGEGCVGGGQHLGPKAPVAACGPLGGSGILRF